MMISEIESCPNRLDTVANVTVVPYVDADVYNDIVYVVYQVADLLIELNGELASAGRLRPRFIDNSTDVRNSRDSLINLS